MEKKTKIMRVASMATATIGFIGLLFTGAANIWDAPSLANLGEFFQLIVSSACIAFGINAGIKTYNKED